jgi:hypothetical protein
LKELKGAVSTPYMIAIVGVLITGIVMSLETQQIMGLQDQAVEDTLPLVAQRIESVMVSVQGLEEAEVEMDMQRELNLSEDGGDPEISYQESNATVETGMNYRLDTGSSDVFCVTQKPSQPVELAAGEC